MTGTKDVVQLPVVTRPVLRYHGGKFRLRGWVIDHLPDHECYVEPFAGAASVLLAKRPSRIEVYNDISHDVVNLFRVLRDPDQSADLKRLLELTPFSRLEFHDAWEKTDDPIESARRYIVQSFQSIGAKHSGAKTGWRTRTTKSRWSPTTSWRNYAEALPAITDRLRDVIIECLDWRRVFPLYDSPTTCWFIDPPYPHQTRKKGYRETYVSELTNEDHVELCQVALGLKGHVLISSYRNPIYDANLGHWERVDINTRAQTNAPRVESMYLSPSVSAKQARLFMEEAS